jgi:dethiobiotin synthetase
MNYFVTGIDTDSGKTLVSAILCQALQADYWKPIQAGLPRDTDTVKQLVTDPAIHFHPERHLLQMPASPHASALAENKEIDLEDFSLPPTSRTLIIEGAGGCLVPINDNHFVIDIAAKLEATIILVADLYLGSINHTLLTVQELKRRALPVKGIIFNGEPNPESQRIISRHAGWPILLHVRREHSVSQDVVNQYAEQLKQSWHA